MIWVIYLAWLGVAGLLMADFTYRILAWRCCQRGEWTNNWLRLAYAYHCAKALPVACVALAAVGLGVLVVSLLTGEATLELASVITVLGGLVGWLPARWEMRRAHLDRNFAWRWLNERLHDRLEE